MKHNMGNVDRIVRTLAAGVIAVLHLMGVIQGTLAIILGAIGVIFLLTSAFSFCPLYALLGISTRKQAPAKQP